MTPILITHDDLDGTVPVILAKVLWSDLSYYQCSYSNIDNIVNSLIDTENTLLIVDISVSEEMAEKLDQRGNVLLIDHHISSKWLKQYDWAMIENDKSASLIFFEYLTSIASIPKLDIYFDLVLRTNDYDLWIHQYNDSKNINQLLYILGHDQFIERFLNNPSIKLEPEEHYVLKTDQDFKERYIDSIESNTKIYRNKDVSFGVCFADRYHSEVGNSLIERKKLDYMYIIDLTNRKVSLRGSGVVDVSIIAKKFGGGGHKNASGFIIDEKIFDEIIKLAISGKDN